MAALLEGSMLMILLPTCSNPSVLKEFELLSDDCSITIFLVSIVTGSSVSVVNSFMTIFTSASSPSKSAEMLRGVVLVIAAVVTAVLVSFSIVVVELVPIMFNVVFLWLWITPEFDIGSTSSTIVFITNSDNPEDSVEFLAIVTFPVAIPVTLSIVNFNCSPVPNAVEFPDAALFNFTPTGTSKST